MGRMLPVLLLGGLAGCAQLAGIDDTSGLIPPDRVSLQMQKVSIGASIVLSPMDLTGLYAQYYVPDDGADNGISAVDGELSADPADTWSAEIKDGSPPVFFDLPDYPTPVRRQLDLPNRNVVNLFGRMEHLNPEPAPTGAMLTVRATLPAPGFQPATEALQLYTLGSWNTKSFGGADLPAMGVTTFAPAAFPFSSVASITGRPLEKITTDDAVLLLRYAAGRLSGVMEAAPFTQTGTDTVMGTLTAVTFDKQLAVQLGPPASVAARYAPARPAVPNIAMNWAVRAAPGYAYGNDNGPLLHSGTVVMADTGAINVMYGNPFIAKGWRSTLTWATLASRNYTPAGQTLPMTLLAGLYQLVLPTMGEALDLPAGLPEVITLDGKPLSTDGLTIPRPAKPVHVSFVSGITNNTLYMLDLNELVPNAANTALVSKYVVAETGVKPEFTIPAEFFEPGKIYSLRAICIQGGYPGVPDGDLTKRELPYAVGYLDGGVFTVTP